MAEQNPPLSAAQFERYRRHLSLPSFGLEGQLRLRDARVLLVGAGGLGCPAAQYLVAAGVGTLEIIDPDVVDLSNLQRQVLYATADIGRPKAEVAAERLRALNPEVQILPCVERFEAANALAKVSAADLVIDGTDNFPARYLSNDACVLAGRPNVYGSISRFEGQASVFDAARGPCYRCLFPEPPPPGSVPSCAEGGVLGVLPGIIATIQATEAVKWLAGIGEPLVGRLLLYDALDLSFREFRIQKDPECPVCGVAPSITELIDYEVFCGVEVSDAVRRVSPVELAARRSGGEAGLLLDVREPEEIAKASIEGAVAIPLGELAARLAELAGYREQSVVVHCHRGGRSETAVRLLENAGFSRVESLDGGIEAWSLTLDPAVPRY